MFNANDCPCHLKPSFSVSWLSLGSTDQPMTWRSKPHVKRLGRRPGSVAGVQAVAVTILEWPWCEDLASRASRDPDRSNILT